MHTRFRQVNPPPGIAALPMYDWPEVRPATDRLWAAIRDGLRDLGVAAPDGLTRDRGLNATWLDPRLVLGQTCGLPLVRALEGRVAVLGAPDCGIEGCPPGWYRSAVVVRADDPREALAAFRGARFAVNDFASQSGYGAMLHHAAQFAGGRAFFGSTHVTGAHVASLAAVAGGRADIAAIDAVTWRYCRRFLPAAGRLRVLMLTEPTPGLPYIAALGTDVPRHRAAVAAGIAAADVQAELGIVGFVPLDAVDYQIIGRRAAVASALMGG